MVERSIKISPEGLRVLRKSALTKVEASLLWDLAATLPITGGPVSHVEMSKKLRVANDTIGKAIKRLIISGLLVRGPRLGLNYHYKLNPVFLRMV